MLFFFNNTHVITRVRTIPVGNNGKTSIKIREEKKNGLFFLLFPFEILSKYLLRMSNAEDSTDSCSISAHPLSVDQSNHSGDIQRILRRYPQ